MNSEANLSLLFKAAIKNSFVADAYAMPVHWFYRVNDIYTAFPDGINQFYAAPEKHPSSIMSLHSKQQGGRLNSRHNDATTEVSVVGDVILKGKEEFWNRANVHYHQGMRAGDNTLNAHTVLWLLQAIESADSSYSESAFLDLYIDNMTAETPVHPDTYAESYHRGFFAHWVQGKSPEKCAAVTHDTPSIGGLVRIGPLVLFLLSEGYAVAECKALAATHLKLTHPDDKLSQVCFQYIDLISALIEATDLSERQVILQRHLKQVAGYHFKNRPIEKWGDNEVIGGIFSTACYITDAWPAVLYLANKYPNDALQALKINTELGGDNVHRGSVLALLLTLVNGTSLDDLYNQLTLSDQIDAVLNQLFVAVKITDD